MIYDFPRVIFFPFRGFWNLAHHLSIDFSIEPQKCLVSILKKFMINTVFMVLDIIVFFILFASVLNINDFMLIGK